MSCWFDLKCLCGKFTTWLSPFAVSLLLLSVAPAWAATEPDFHSFDDEPLDLDDALEYPDWFNLSFLDLNEDLQDVAEAGKKGLLVYFGQKYCAYCKALLEGNFGMPDIKDYTQRHFDVVGIDIHGSQPVTDLKGETWSERTFATWEDVNFTPTVIFYDAEGYEALRLSGYYPPYKFRAALEYVADDHYRNETFRDYLARADVPLIFEEGGMNVEDYFLPGPYMLDRSRLKAERPLMVFFEQGDCHACDILHTGPLKEPEITRRLDRLETVQLNLWGSTKVITPDGQRLTAKEWAEQLDLFYAPTLLFFDEQGKEIIRVASVVQFYRLRNVLDFVITGAFRTQPNFQRWRNQQKRKYLLSPSTPPMPVVDKPAMPAP